MDISYANDDHHLARQLQSHEFLQASASNSDLHLALELQLQEALSASASLAGLHPPSPHQLHHPPPPHDDLSIAFDLHNAEVSRAHQESLDQQLASEHTQTLRQELERRIHDARFARSLMDMPQWEWEDFGDEYEKPFVSTPVETLTKPYNLFVTSIQTRNEGATLCGMGAVILDSENNVIFELQKAVDIDNVTIAQYMALVAGLEVVHSLGLSHVEAHTDCSTVYNQVTGNWRVHSHKNLRLLSQVKEQTKNLHSFKMSLHSRDTNLHAIRLATDASKLQLTKKEREADGSCHKKAKLDTELCSICLDSKVYSEMHCISTCKHRFCLSCVIQHMEAKVQGGQVQVSCPQVDCCSFFPIDECKSLLSSESFELLSKRLLEATIPEAEKVYCPYPDCSALMIRNEINKTHQASCSSSRSRIFGRTKCLECCRSFCADCRVPWHSSMTCKQYQELPSELKDTEGAKLHKLAKHKKWQRCSRCGSMVELSEGCFHITCRCGCEFCYLCGTEWKHKKQICKCVSWEIER